MNFGGTTYVSYISSGTRNFAPISPFLSFIPLFFLRRAQIQDPKAKIFPRSIFCRVSTLRPIRGPWTFELLAIHFACPSPVYFLERKDEEIVKSCISLSTPSFSFPFYTAVRRCSLEKRCTLCDPFRPVSAAQHDSLLLRWLFCPPPSFFSFRFLSMRKIAIFGRPPVKVPPLFHTSVTRSGFH